MNSPNSNSSGNSMAGMDEQQFHASLDALLEREMFWMPPGSNLNPDGHDYSESPEHTNPTMPEESENIVTRTTVASEAAPIQETDVLVGQSQREAMMSTIKDAFPRLAGSVGQPSPLTARLGTVPMPLTLPQLTSLPPPMSAAFVPQATSPQPWETAKSSGKRMRSSASASSAVSEDEDEKMRRRYDRNVREQQRSHKITEQIDFLREVLSSAKVPFKPNKFSILFNVARYIEQLQQRSATLDAEHKKLLDTITRTNELVNRHLAPQVSDTSSTNDSVSDPHPESLISMIEDETLVFVQGLDYKGVFRHCGLALAVASIDGRFLDCNEEFEEITGFNRKELIPSEFESGDSLPDRVESSHQVSKARKICAASSPSPKNLSMFNILTRQDMEIVFRAMSEMLKRLVNVGSKPSAEPKDYWCGRVTLSRRKSESVRMNVSLVRSRNGRPRFFNCAVTPEFKSDANFNL